MLQIRKSPTVDHWTSNGVLVSIFAVLNLLIFWGEVYQRRCSLCLVLFTVTDTLIKFHFTTHNCILLAVCVLLVVFDVVFQHSGGSHGALCGSSRQLYRHRGMPYRSERRRQRNKTGKSTNEFARTTRVQYSMFSSIYRSWHVLIVRKVLYINIVVTGSVTAWAPLPIPYT